jgi:hypothetical protein
MSHVRNIDVTHELSDVNVPAILKFVVALTVMTIVVFVLMWLLFGLFNAQESKKESDRPRGPMAMTEQERLPPEPRLQAAPGFGVNRENGTRVNLETREPEAEYRVLRKQWEDVLREGARDQSGKVVGLPIEDAMQKVIQGSGLPARTNVLEGSGWVAEDYGAAMPTAASSGRVTEKRKQ